MSSEQQQRIMGYFIEEAKDHLNTIEQGLLNLQSTIEDPEMASEMFRAAHSVKGGAAMLGLNSIQHTSHRLEDYFKVLKECPIKVDQRLETLLLRVFDTLQELLEQLQGPFGLTDDKVVEVMSEVEPVFGELNQHLNHLVSACGSVPPEDVELSSGITVAAAPVPSPVSRTSSQPVAREESALQLIFQSDVPARLREMLQLFKQPDTLDGRQQLQNICRTLIMAGEQFDLPEWCALIATTQQAIASPDNSYRALAPVVIKDIKQGQELVLAGNSVTIEASASLLALVPQRLEPEIEEPDFADLLADMGFESEEPAEFSDFALEVDSLDSEPAIISPDVADSVFAADAFDPSVFDDAEGFPSEDSINEQDWFDNISSEQDTVQSDSSLGFDQEITDADIANLNFADLLEEVEPSDQLSERNGPEVGMAELNSLADLFEGEVPELGMTWQEEEVVNDPTGDLSIPEIDTTSDFSDLLFDQENSDDLVLDVAEDDDLSGLLNHSELMANRTTGSQQDEIAAYSPIDDSIDDLDWMALSSDSDLSSEGENNFSAFSFNEDVLASTPSVAEEAVRSTSDFDDLNDLFAGLEDDELVGADGFSTPEVEAGGLDSDEPVSTPLAVENQAEEVFSEFDLGSDFDLDLSSDFGVDDRSTTTETADAGNEDWQNALEAEGQAFPEFDIDTDLGLGDRVETDTEWDDAIAKSEDTFQAFDFNSDLDFDDRPITTETDEIEDVDWINELELADELPSITSDDLQVERSETAQTDDVSPVEGGFDDQFGSWLSESNSEAESPDPFDTSVWEDPEGIANAWNELTASDNLPGSEPSDASVNTSSFEFGVADFLTPSTETLPSDPSNPFAELSDLEAFDFSSESSWVETPSDEVGFENEAQFDFEAEASPGNEWADFNLNILEDGSTETVPSEHGNDGLDDRTSVNPTSSNVQSNLDENGEDALTDSPEENWLDTGMLSPSASDWEPSVDAELLTETFVSEDSTNSDFDNLFADESPATISPDAFDFAADEDSPSALDDLESDRSDAQTESVNDIANGFGAVDAFNFGSSEADLDDLFGDDRSDELPLSSDENLLAADSGFQEFESELSDLFAEESAETPAELPTNAAADEFTIADPSVKADETELNSLFSDNTESDAVVTDLSLETDLLITEEIFITEVTEPLFEDNSEAGFDNLFDDTAPSSTTDSVAEVQLEESKFDGDADLDQLFEGNNDYLEQSLDSTPVDQPLPTESDLSSWLDDAVVGSESELESGDRLDLFESFDAAPTSDTLPGIESIEFETQLSDSGEDSSFNLNLEDSSSPSENFPAEELNLDFNWDDSSNLDELSTEDLEGFTSELEQSFGLDESLLVPETVEAEAFDEAMLGADQLNLTDTAEEFDTSLDSFDFDSLASDLDDDTTNLTADSPEAIDFNSELGDISLDGSTTELIKDSANVADSEVLADLSDLNILLDASAEEPINITNSDTGLADLDALLDDADALSSVDMGVDSSTEDSVDFANLESFLAEEVATAPESANSNAADSDDFSDLEALLGDELQSVAPVASESSSAPSASEIPSLESLDEFDDLEKLLKDADQSLGGSPTNRGSRSPAAANNRRASRRSGGISDQTMRVTVKHLDNLNNLVGELVVNRNSLEQAEERLRQFLDNLLYQVQQLSDVGQRMRDLYERSLLESSLLSSRKSYQLSSQAGLPQTQSDHATGISFDALEMDRFTGFHTLSQEMIELIVRVRESASDIDFVVDETDQITRTFRQVTTQLQEGLTRSRMVPFAQIADRLPRAVRDISLQNGKQAELIVEGRDTLIDKMILEQLYDPMTHLVNNAIAHGIETPEQRQGTGKSIIGRITVRAFHQGNQTVISVTDDGAGIDPERVKSKAIEKGLITAADAQHMSRLDVYDLLFHHGFSTKDKADNFAGRGVGMDVVRTSLNEIRGVINIDSTVGKGTTFTIRLPLTLSISKALCCISNRARIAFPMDGVEDMLDVPKDRIQTDDQGRTCIQWRDTLLPFQPLSDLLKYNRVLGRGSVYGGNQEDDIVSVVVLRSNAGNFLALQIDQVLGEQEIVIKQLEGPVPKPIGVAGATVLGDGRIMPIADVLELIDLSMGRIRREAGSSLWEKGEDQVPVEAPPTKTEPTVLIVDDSITVRELLSMTFNKVGYRVEQARDGQEAWEKLRSGLPCDLVFCDIEMPRMDGLELLSRIQKDSHLNHLPIAMLTSRGADRHRQMAIQLGAKGYFTKPYLEEALLDAAQRMLKGEVLVVSNS